MDIETIIQKYKDGVISYREAYNFIYETPVHHFKKLRAYRLLRVIEA